MADQPLRSDGSRSALPDVTQTETYDLPVAGPRTLDLTTVPAENYTVLAEHARGGIGRVLRAEDRRLGRTVAVKELLRDHPDTEQRFLREARVTARLQHPAIVPIYEAGRWADGRPFYAMRFIDGRPLKALIEERPTLEERLALLPNVIAVAEAIAYAHQRRVIHRDLKPNNVVVGDFGETMVVDWGLAKELDANDDADAATPSPASAAQTHDGMLVGTPAYMAPEQARRQPADERSDIYGIGAILYTVVSGRAPYAGVPAAKIAEAVVQGAPSIRRMADVPAELATIIDKAMATSPADRYQNAGELVRELKRFVAGQRVGAHHYSWWALAGRWVARHRTAMLLSLAFVALLLVGAAVALRRIVIERDHTRTSYERLVLERARAALVEEPAATLAWLKNYPPHAADWTEARELALRALDAAPARHVIQQPRNIHGPRWFFSPDGKRVAGMAAADELGVWDVASGALIARNKIAPTTVLSTAFADPDTVIVWTGSQQLGVWPIHSHEVRWLPTGAAGDRTGFSTLLGPDGLVVMTSHELSLVPLDGRPPRRLAAWKEPINVFERAASGRMMLVAHGGILTLISVPDGATLHEWDERCPGVFPTGFSADERHIGVSCHGNVRVLDTVSFAVEKIAYPSADVAKTVGRFNTSLAPDGKRLAIAGPADAVRLWDLASGSLRIVGRHHALATAVRFMPAGDRLISGGRDRTLRIWHLNGTLERVIAADDNVAPDALSFTSDGRFFGASGVGNAIRLWRTPDPVVMRPHYDGLWMAQSADGSSLLHASYAGWLNLLDAHTGARRAEAYAEGVSLLGVSLAPDGRTAIYWTNAGSAVTELGIWDTSTAAPKRVQLQSPLATAAFTPDNSRILALHANGEVSTWTRDGELVAKSALPAAPPSASMAHGAVGRIAFVAGGGLAVISDGSASVHLFDWTHSQRVRSIAFGGRVTAMALSSDGRSLVATGPDRQLRLVDLGKEGTVRTVASLPAAPRALALTPAGAAAAVSLEDGTVVVIHLATGALRATLPPAGVVGDLTFSRDGRWLATASSDSTVRLWSTSDWTMQRLFAHDQTGGVRSVRFSVDGEHLFWTGMEIGLGSGRVPTHPDVPATPEKLLGWIAEQTSAVVAPGRSPASP
ncbi:MAG: WD40 repeat domain-containing serine/threonine protein kinase [Polyangia bacterium]